MASGEVRGFDARTGALKWTWDPIPRTAMTPRIAKWRGEMAQGKAAVRMPGRFSRPIRRRDLVFVADGQRRAGLLRRPAPRRQPLRELPSSR
jgi:quinoprotein glucose dehydrogenase